MAGFSDLMLAQLITASHLSLPKDFTESELKRSLIGSGVKVFSTEKERSHAESS